MEVLVEVRWPGGASENLAVELGAHDTVGSLVAGLCEHAAARGLGAIDPAAAELELVDEHRCLSPDLAPVGAGLMSGATLRVHGDRRTAPGIGGPPRPRRAAVLDVAGGPLAGRSFELLPGDHLVGRAREAAIVLGDPTVSRRQLWVHVGAGAELGVAPATEAAGGVLVDGRSIGGYVAVGPDQPVVVGSTTLFLRPCTLGRPERRDGLGQVPHNRVPYRRSVVTSRALPALPAPPERPDPRPLPLLAALAPGLGAVAMALVFSSPRLLLLALFTPLLLGLRSYSAKRAGGKRFERDRAAFRDRVAARAGEVDDALVEELRERHASAPDLALLARAAARGDVRLWERNREAPDVLELRVGQGRCPSRISTPIEGRGQQELRDEAARRLAHHAVLPYAPITIPLLTAGALGLHGDPGQVTRTGRALIVQAACQHSPEDLVIAAVIAAERQEELSFLPWLPHTRAATSPLEGEHLAVGAEQGRRLLAGLLQACGLRLERAQKRLGTWPAVLLVLDEAAGIDRPLLSKLLDVGPAAGIATIWMGRAEHQLPRQCSAMLACAPLVEAQASVLRSTDPGVPDQPLDVDGIDADVALSVARHLAPLRDASSAGATSAIPRQVGLLDVLGLPVPSARGIAARWASGPRDGLAAPVGVDADGPFTLDLVEQGPHTLIAGTSGSGKSELLTTLVAALAASHPPDRLAFLFVDYKGGAGTSAFRDLPHAAGHVTNLDGRLSLRVLTSLRAELTRRMALLEGRAKDLGELQRVAPADAPPRLVLVVDEFATLVKEVPDFVAGIVDIAQRGRSLGIHLVLATQRPTGVVNENILANTNLRIALRVIDPADSQNILGAKDAADLPVPLRGRAYVRSGPGPLGSFQTAWSGAPFEARRGHQPVALRPFGFGPPTHGDPRPSPRVEGSEAGPTQVEVLLGAIARASHDLGFARSRPPWLPPLPDVVTARRLDDHLDPELRAAMAADPGRWVPIGLIDDPEHQAQRPAVVDLEATGGLLVVGAGGTGKTTLLRSVGAALDGQGTRQGGVVLYALDAASRALEQLAALPSTAAVVHVDEVERVTRLVTVLTQEVARRREVLAAASVDSLSALRATAGGRDVPRLVLLLDGYAALHAALDRPESIGWLPLLHRLAADGRQVGIHLVVASDRRTLPPPLLAALGSRVALRQADPADLTAFGVPLKAAKEADLPPGRGFLDGEAEVQLVSLSEDPAGAAQAAALAEIGASRAVLHPPAPPALPELPDHWMVESEPSGSHRAVLALDDLSLDPVEVSLARRHLVVTGPPLSGRSTALATVAAGLHRSTPGLVIAAVGAATSSLAGLAPWDLAGFGRTRMAPVLEELLQRFGTSEAAEARAVLFVDAAEDVEPAAARLLEQLVRLDAVRACVAADGGTIAKGFSGWIAEVRRARSTLVLQPEGRGDVETVAGARPRFRPDQPFPPGRGVLVADRAWRLVQVGLAEPVPAGGRAAFVVAQP